MKNHPVSRPKAAALGLAFVDDSFGPFAEDTEVLSGAKYPSK